VYFRAEHFLSGPVLDQNKQPSLGEVDDTNKIRVID
jgi:hypothetical protein